MSEALKTTVITNLDATPPVRATSGAGAQGFRQVIYGTLAPTNAATSTSTYRMARVPSTATDVSVEIEYQGTITTFTTDITLYYSDDTNDEEGAGSGDTGLVNSLNGASSLFAHAEAWGGLTAGVVTNVTNQAVQYSPANRAEPLWQAAGLTSDPGGFFDVTLATTATNSVATAVIGVRVGYAMPYSS